LKTRVAIAEDHQLVREALKLLLSSQASLDIVGEAADGAEALAISEKLRPDVLILDLCLPRVHGLEVIRALRRKKPPHILVLTMHAEDSYVMEALQNGARGYLLKDSPSEELYAAVRTVATGGEFITEIIRDKVYKAALSRLKPGQLMNGQVEISQRERSVLELAAQGKTNAEIAENLYISRRTAEAHRASLMKKLGLKSQTDLVLYAVRKGIVTP
jgi:two-component system, NarL family, response regulator NreC